MKNQCVARQKKSFVITSSNRGKSEEKEASCQSQKKEETKIDD